MTNSKEVTEYINEMLDGLEPMLKELRDGVSSLGYVLVIETTPEGKFDFFYQKKGGTI
jgi:hypothetical protein